MSSVMNQLASAFDALARSYESPFRGETRQDTVQIVEYVPFPRASADHTSRIGFTRDLSASGMCIGTDHPEGVGSLLRVVLRHCEGGRVRPTVMRVVWCRATRDGRFWLGLEHLSELR